MAVLLATLFPLIGFVAPAHAAGKVTIANLKLTKSDANGNELKPPLYTRDIAKLTFDWDARNTTLTSGDSFTVKLPKVFENLEHPHTRELKVDHNGTQVVVGKCDLTKKDIVCSFNGKVDELRRQGFTGFHGSATALLSVTEAMSSGKAAVTVDGSTVSVDIPGGGIKQRPKSAYTPGTLDKVGGDINSKSNLIYWGINFGSDYAAQALNQAGKPTKFDGKTRSSITFTDVLGPGQAFIDDLQHYQLSIRSSASEPKNRDIVLTAATGKDWTTKYGDFDLTVTKRGNTATITATGPWAPNTNYRISYLTRPTTHNGLIQPGFKYVNQATLAGTERAARFERYYSDSFTVDVKMEAGFGTFNVTKLLEGEGSGKVAKGTKFTVKVKYTLPGGATVESYKGWKAPGAVNASRTGGTVDFTVVAGQKANFTAATFPKGTTIELSEDPASASPAVPGIAWGTPEFKVGGQVKNSFAVEDRKSTAVELTNAVSQQLGTFSVAKSGTGANVTSKEFAFAYQCSDGQSGKIKVKGDGRAVQSGVQAKLGTTCKVTEDQASAGVPGYDLKAEAAKTVTISKAGGVVPLAFVNAYTPQVGDFSIAKSVAGNDAAKARSYAFTYDCGPDGKGRLSVPGDGKAVRSPSLRAGATCAIAEEESSAQIADHSLKAELSQSKVTIAKGSTVTVTAKNTYARDMGSFTVRKAVVSNGADFAKGVFDVDYACTDGTKGSLKVPGNGTLVQGPAVPVGTSCDISERQASAQRDGYSLATAVDTPKVTIAKGAKTPVTVTNTYTRLVGGFTIGKTVDGDGAGLAPKAFDFAYACVDSSGAKTIEGTVTVAAGKSQSVADVPTGSCTVTEKNAAAKNAKHSTAISANGKAGKDGSVTFNVTDGAAIAVNATNTYTLDRGAFSVVKKAEGLEDSTLKAKAFTFDYVCESHEGKVSGSLTARADGSPVKAGHRLPSGAKCTVRENAAAAQVAGYDLAAPQTQTVTIGAKDSVVALSFTNAYTRHVGDFAVAKKVSGASGQEGRDFAFDYACTNGVKGSLIAKGDGVAVKSGHRLPVGTQCTVMERSGSAELAGYTLKAPAAQKVTVGEKGQIVEADFVNDYTPVAKPTPKAGEPTPKASTQPSAQPSQPGASSPSATAEKGGSLPRTGASIIGLAALGLGALAAGAALTARRRRS